MPKPLFAKKAEPPVSDGAVLVIKALQKLKATGVKTATDSVSIRKETGLNLHMVRYYINSVPELIEKQKVPGVKAQSFWLTRKGLKHGNRK